MARKSSKQKRSTSNLITALFLIALVVLVRWYLNTDQGQDLLSLISPENGPQPTLSVIVSDPESDQDESSTPSYADLDIDNLPESDGVTPYVEINDNVPFFSDEDKQLTEPFEYYSDLDQLGRCGVAYANICVELQPTEKRGDISSIKPTGWKQNSYPDLIKDVQLYNRCHLIGFQLAGENANKLNLITGTRYLNVTGMLPFENAVDDYIDENPNNHVLYRVTPVFVGNELVARGVLMEAYSVEDQGELEFCIYCFNIQPGIWINYVTGENGIIA